MKQRYRDEATGEMRYGKVYIGPPKQEPDVRVKLDAHSFDQFARKELKGMNAYLSGRLRFDGSLFKLKRFEANVVDKYLYEELIKRVY
mmetsp:Transcript_12918/g.21862  ORF Transcript_12918/g.21862 Transcript_12918/m.21862 type:complete len:88 (+) Transcript_12918:938-1201(+)